MLDDCSHTDESTTDPRTRRLLDAVMRMGRVTGEESRSADERLRDVLGEDVLRAVHRELEQPSGITVPQQAVVSTAARAEAETHCRRRRGLGWLARLKQWQSSLFFAALGCGAAVAIVGVIDLIAQLRLVISGVGAVAVVVTVFFQTRHRQGDEGWIGS